MEQGPDFWCWFDTTQFSYHCVHPIHAKMFSIQMLLHFSQIVQRVCTLVLFIIQVAILIYDPMRFNNIYCQDLSAPYGVLVVPGDAKVPVTESVEVEGTETLCSDVVAVMVHTLQLHDAKMCQWQLID